MKHAILKRLKRTDHLPMLFVGSGISIRYLGLENWKELLRKFAQLATDNDYAYEMYEQQAKGLECKEGLLPKVAELVERDFNLRWFKDDQFKKSREQSAEEINCSGDGVYLLTNFHSAATLPTCQEPPESTFPTCCNM